MSAPVRLTLVLGIFAAGAVLALVVVMLGMEVPEPTVEGEKGGAGREGWRAGRGPDGDGWDDEEFDRLDGPDEYLDPLDLVDGGDPGSGASGEDGASAGRRSGRERGGEDDGGGRRRTPEERAAARGEPNPGGKHVDLLKEVLDSGDPEKLRMFLVSTMSARGSELGEAEAVLLLEAIGEEKNPGLQNAMIMHLERVGGEGVTQGLIEFLDSKQRSGVASRTLQALGRIGGPFAMPALVDALGNPTLGRARRTAADVLGRSKDPGVVGPLATTLGAADRGTRQLAAATLVRVGTPEGYQAVVDYAASGDAGDRAFGRRLIERSTRGPAAVPVMGAALGRESDAALRVSLARSLGRSKSPEASRYLIQAAANDGKAQVRIEAINALARLGATSSYAEVERISQEDPNKAVKKAAKRALNRLAR